VLVTTVNACGDVMVVESIAYSTTGDGSPVVAAAKVTLLEHWSSALGTTMSAGQVIVGALLIVAVVVVAADMQPLTVTVTL